MNAFADLWDWRRRIDDLYAGIRRNPDPVAAWREWQSVRDEMSPYPSADSTGRCGASDIQWRRLFPV